MAKRRTLAEINKDYKKCKKYVDNCSTITSLKEIAEAVGLTEPQVVTSLSLHPRVFEKIKKQIAENREVIKAQHQTRKVVKTESMLEEETFEANKKEEAESVPEVKEDDSMRYVIDASIAGAEGAMESISRIYESKCKIILTSITIKELEKMQKFHDDDAHDARKILAMAAGDYEHFECVLIDETIGIPDDCIIKYCADNRENVILLTSDKTMDLKARTYGIKTQFFRQNREIAPVIGLASGTKINTIYGTKCIEGRLFISNFGNNFKSTRVISGGIEYNSGTVELRIGDDVFIATKKHDYMTFAHYKIISLFEENNCKQVYFKRLYNQAEISELPKADYKSFMRDFKRKVNYSSFVS